jgi:molybdopterin synthase sulfur carrier subunit
MTKVLYFAKLREDLGCESESLALPEGVKTVASLRVHLAARGGPWASALAPERAVRAAVNQQIAKPETPVATGDEVAFFPPVTGG